MVQRITWAVGFRTANPGKSREREASHLLEALAEEPGTAPKAGQAVGSVSVFREPPLPKKDTNLGPPPKKKKRRRKKKHGCPFGGVP